VNLRERRFWITLALNVQKAKSVNVAGLLDHVGESSKYPTICERCVAALEEIEKEAA